MATGFGAVQMVGTGLQAVGALGRAGVAGAAANEIKQNPLSAGIRGGFESTATATGQAPNRFSVSQDLRNRIAGAGGPERNFIGDLIQGKLGQPTPQRPEIPGGELSLMQARRFAESLAEFDPELADAFNTEIQQQMGPDSFPLDPGATDFAVTRAQDFQQENEIAGRNRERLMGITEGLAGQLQGSFAQSFDAVNRATSQTLATIGDSVKQATRDLNSGRLLSLLPIQMAQKLREDALNRVGEGRVAELDVMVGGTQVALDQSRRELEASLNNNPNMPEAAKQRLLLSHDLSSTGILGDVAQKVNAHWNELEIKTRQFADQHLSLSTAQAASDFGGLSRSLADVQRVKADLTRLTRANEMANKVNIETMRRAGFGVIADMMLLAQEQFNPRTNVLNDIMALNVFNEARERSDVMSAYQLYADAFSSIGNLGTDITSQDLTRQQIAASQPPKRGPFGLKTGGGALAGAGVGAILAAPTGGLSMGAGALLGGAAGGGFGLTMEGLS